MDAQSFASVCKALHVFRRWVCDVAWMGQKISAKQLKTSEGGDSSCANTLLYDCFLLTSTHYKLIVPPILNKPSWAD